MWKWLGQKENPKGYGWATDENYGYSIVEMIRVMEQLPCKSKRSMKSFFRQYSKRKEERGSL